MFLRQILRERARALSNAAHAALQLLTILCLGTSAQAAWQVSVDGSDVTALANPLDRLGKPCVNVLSVASALGLQTRIDGRILWITDSMGVRWHCVNGDVSLISPGRTLAMSVPCSITGFDAYLPVDTLAALAGLQCKIDTSRQTAEIELSRTHAASTRDEELANMVPDGWKPMFVEKTPGEIAAPSGFIEITPATRLFETTPSVAPAATQVVPAQPSAVPAARIQPAAETPAVMPVPVPVVADARPAHPAISPTIAVPIASSPSVGDWEMSPAMPLPLPSAPAPWAAKSAPALTQPSVSTPVPVPAAAPVPTVQPTVSAPAPAPSPVQQAEVPTPSSRRAPQATYTSTLMSKPVLVTNDGDSVPAGWSDIIVPKTAAELGASALADQGDNGIINLSNQKSVLPDKSDTLRVNTITGYVPGYDGDEVLSATGRIMGDEVTFQGVGSYGGQGLLFQPLELRVDDIDHGRRFDLGSLYSDLWSTTTGVRYSIDKGANSWSSLSLYQPLAGQYHHGELLDYRDDWWITRGLNLGGEVASDGSAVGRGKIRAGSLSVFGTYGTIEQTHETDYTVGANYNVGRLMSIGASDSHTGIGITRDDYRTYTLLIPITKRLSLNAMNSQGLTPTTTTTTNSIGLTAPILMLSGSLLYQWTNSEFDPINFHTTAIQYRSVSASLGGDLNSRLNMGYQGTANWQEQSAVALQHQVSAMYKIDRANSFYLIDTFAQVNNPTQLQIRLTHNFTKSEALSVGYGSLIPYQNESIPANAKGFQLMWNQSLDLATPSVGGIVNGKVENVIGRPVKNVKVCLGQYIAYTTDDGRYEFRNLPRGSYELYVDDSSLPANFHECCPKQVVGVDNRRTVTRDFQLVPLGSVTGYVYNDKKGTGRYEAGEGVANVLVRMGEFTTITGSDGFYGFYNADPGKYFVEVDPNHILSGFVPDSAKRPVDLRADQSVRDVNVKLVFHDKPVELQELK